MTQLERVLKAARSFRGTCQAEWLGPVADGGPRITRLAARLQEAEDRYGYQFECLGKRAGTKVYRLVEGSGVERGDEAVPSVFRAATGQQPVSSLSVEPDDLRLFEPPVPSALKEAA